MDTSRHVLRKISAATATLQGPRGILLVCGLAIGILIAGCGTSSNSPAATNPPAAAQNTPESTESALPGKEEFGYNEEDLVPLGEQVEVLIAECMSDAGFEYIAVDWDTIRAGMGSDKNLPGLPEEEFVKVHGFGITVFYTGGPPQLNEVPIPAQVAFGEKNIEIFKGLSPADQIAYNQTLLGDNKDFSFAIALEYEDFSRTGGCTRDAIEEVFGTDLLAREYTKPTMDSIIEQDPRMTEAHEVYAACMREGNFSDFNVPEDVDTYLRETLVEVTGGQPVEQLSVEAQEALKELQDFEKKVALVSHECELEKVEPVADTIEAEMYTGVQR